MNESMCRVQRGSFVYYTCRRIPVRHAFTTKFGGVSTGACESLNLGFNRGDELENVRENYRLLGEALGVDEARMTLTKQIHDTQVSVVTEDKVGMGLHRPMEWQSDAIVTALPEVGLAVEGGVYQGAHLAQVLGACLFHLYQIGRASCRERV